MRRIEPPPLATWLLEHLTPGERDEALAGDLLEDFHSGRSDAWYWRQVVGAVVMALYRSLQERAPLLLFTVVWSMLVPAWTVFLDRISNNTRILGPLWQMEWPFSALSRFALWMSLNLVFLWGGMLVYCLFLTRFFKIPEKRRIRRALAVVPSIFLPIYVATLILMNLFAWPGLQIDRRSLTPGNEMIDIGTWANVLRIPYFITLLTALWGVVPRLPRFSSSLSALKQAEHFSELDSFAVVRELDPYTCKRFIAFMVGAGVLNAMIAGVLLCRLPDSHSPTLSALFSRAAVYVILGGLAGVCGAWFYWRSPASPFRNDAPVPFSEFAVVCASGWVWVPAMVIFCEQVSPVAAWVAMIAAYLLAVGLRNATAPVFAPDGQSFLFEEAELFAASLYRAPFDGGGYVIAVCLAAAGWALATHSNYTAAALLACAAFLFAWMRTVPRFESAEPVPESRRAMRRLAAVIFPAIVITAWALLAGVAHREHDAVEAALASSAADAQRHSGTAKRPEPGVGPGGFESVILWPFPPKKQLIPPLPEPTNLRGPKKSKPMTIRFDGAYWYFQPPETSPGRNAHQAHGTPLGIDIQSNNSFPLVMEAHQRLIGPVRISRCGEIDVEIENRDNLRGTLSLGVMLGDSTLPNKPTLYLGRKEIETSMPGFFSYKAAPLFETLRFAVPATGSIRKFDEITLMLIPDIEHAMIGPKIAISQFELLPR